MIPVSLLKKISSYNFISIIHVCLWNPDIRWNVMIGNDYYKDTTTRFHTNAGIYPRSCA